jgi:hypothetical protein
MAAHHQHGNNHRHVPDGVPDPKHSEQGWGSYSGQTRQLVRVTSASNAFIGIELLTEEEVNEFREKCKAAAERAGHSAVMRAGAGASKAADEAV